MQPKKRMCDPFFSQSCLNHRSFLRSLQKAQSDSATLTTEYIAANMAPDEKLRLSTVRNIGIAVCVSCVQSCQV